MFGFKYIKSNVKNFSGDRFCVLVCLLSIIIVGFHTWQFIGSDYNYNCFVRVAFFFSVTPGTALFGRKAAYVMLVFFFLWVSVMLIRLIIIQVPFQWKFSRSRN